MVMGRAAALAAKAKRGAAYRDRVASVDNCVARQGRSGTLADGPHVVLSLGVVHIAV
jgi:hypothetical protein